MAEIYKASIRPKMDAYEYSTGKKPEKVLFTSIKTLKIGDKEIKGYILASSNIMIALYLPPSDTTQEQVAIIPLNSISEIRAMKPETQ